MSRRCSGVMSGQGERARESSTIAMALSPLDPLFYAMLATHAQSYLCDDNFADAAAWAERAARAPGAHYFLAAIAAVAHHLNGDPDKAAYWADNLRGRRPDMRAETFFGAFPITDPALKDKFDGALTTLGF